MTQRTNLLLKQLEMLIPGYFNLREKLAFESEFHRLVGTAIEDASNEAADHREREILEGLHQFYGWREDIDKMTLLMSKDPHQPLIWYLGDRLRQFVNIAKSSQSNQGVESNERT